MSSVLIVDDELVQRERIRAWASVIAQSLGAGSWKTTPLVVDG